ncbi:hypothetical protein Fmac_008777 [Flemingia macrophylla]|uniref:Uncharacterized protein n=1 Tax=Flemingia macrophylla TaxID=520843 RepID=A0ABD1MYD6_9FABA
MKMMLDEGKKKNAKGNKVLFQVMVKNSFWVYNGETVRLFTSFEKGTWDVEIIGLIKKGVEPLR